MIRPSIGRKKCVYFVMVWSALSVVTLNVEKKKGNSRPLFLPILGSGNDPIGDERATPQTGRAASMRNSHQSLMAYNHLKRSNQSDNERL